MSGSAPPVFVVPRASDAKSISSALSQRELDAVERAKKSPPSAAPIQGILPTPSIQAQLLRIESSLVLDHKTVQYGRRLGVGSLGEVFQGRWNLNEVVIRVLTNKKFTVAALTEFKQEIEAVAALHSEYIVQLRGLCESPRYCLVMEYMSQGSLSDFLRNGQDLPWHTRIRIALDVIYGLAELHEIGIVHGNLRGLNVLLDNRLRAKLSDFGLAQMRAEVRATSRSHQASETLPWMGPELFKPGARHTFQSDMYSFGVILWELAARKRPLADIRSLKALKSWMIEGKKEAVPEEVQRERPLFAQLIQKCWGSAGQRPTAQEAIEALAKVYQAELKAALPSCAVAGVQPTAAEDKEIVGNLAFAERSNGLPLSNPGVLPLSSRAILAPLLPALVSRYESVLQGVSPLLGEEEQRQGAVEKPRAMIEFCVRGGI